VLNRSTVVALWGLNQVGVAATECFVGMPGGPKAMKAIDMGGRIRRSLRQTDAKTQEGNVKQSGGGGTAVPG
jgi:hypothetical protein